MSADPSQNAGNEVIDNWEDDPEQAVQMVEQKMRQVRILKRNEEERRAFVQQAMQEEEERKELEQIEKEKRAAMGLSHIGEASVSEETPLQIKVLRRPDGASNSNLANGLKTDEAKPTKTLEERQAAYDEARNRIFGDNFTPEELAAIPPIVEASKSRSKSPEIIRIPRNPPLMGQPMPLMNGAFMGPPLGPPLQHQNLQFYPPMQNQTQQPFPLMQSPFPGASMQRSTSPPQEYTTRFDDFIASQGTGRPLLYFDPSRPPPPLMPPVSEGISQGGGLPMFFVGSMPQQPPRPVPLMNQQIPMGGPPMGTYADQLVIKNLNSQSQANRNSTKAMTKSKKGAKRGSHGKS